jgi:ferredoxin
MMIVTVDRHTCSGHGRCNALAPEVFVLDSDGYLDIDNVEVPPELESIARDAVSNCPERAIKLVGEQ